MTKLTAAYKRVLGALVKRLPDSMTSATIEVALWYIERNAYLRLRDHGFRPGGIIDIGAYRGDWARSIKSIFGAPLLMIEARNEMKTWLDRVVSEHRDISYQIALLGSSECEIDFHVQDTGSSIYAERSNAPRTVIPINMATLDLLNLSMKPPLFIKIDVQGAELDVLSGAEQTLAKTEVLQLEVPLLPYNEGAPTIEKEISFLSDHGFVIYDIAGFIRPKGHLAQMDMLFVRRDSKLRPNYFTYDIPQSD